MNHHFEVHHEMICGGRPFTVVRMDKDMSHPLQRTALDIAYREFRPHCQSDAQFFGEMANAAPESSYMVLDGMDQETSRVAGAYFIGILERHGATLPLIYSSFTQSGKITYPDRWVRTANGIALAVSPEYRGIGIGKYLMDELPKSLEVDCIHCLHLASLGNIRDWLKRQSLMGILGNPATLYMTGKAFAEDVRLQPLDEHDLDQTPDDQVFFGAKFG